MIVIAIMNLVAWVFQAVVGVAVLINFFATPFGIKNGAARQPSFALLVAMTSFTGGLLLIIPWWSHHDPFLTPLAAMILAAMFVLDIAANVYGAAADYGEVMSCFEFIYLLLAIGMLITVAVIRFPAL
jgi:hypothetical protein